MADYGLVISEAEVRRYQLMAEGAQQAEAALWEQAGVVPGATVADVGCGPAAVSVELGKAVGPAGRVYGIERDEGALAAAKVLVEASGLGNVEVRSGIASDTGLEPASADVVMCRHVLGHNASDEQRIVDHLASVCRPGGAVYLVDSDVAAATWLDADPDLDDMNERYLEFHRRRGNDLKSGLRLAKLLRVAGLEVEAFEGRYNIVEPPPGVRPPVWAAREDMLREGVVSDSDIARWESGFARMDARPERFTSFVPIFVGLGRKPTQ
jgi:SAM-dependent methyltransferase